MRRPEAGPLGETFFEASDLAIVAAFLVNKPAPGCVESVFTLATHLRLRFVGIFPYRPLKYCTARSCACAAFRVRKVPKLRLFPVLGFLLREYSRYSPDFSFRITGVRLPARL